MRIGIDGHVLGKGIGGVERFVAALVERLPSIAPEHEYIVFVTQRYFDGLAQSTRPGLRFVALASANPIIGRLILLPVLVHRLGLDALLVQRVAPFFCGRCKLIVAVHDLTPLKFADRYKGLSNRLVRLLTPGTLRRAALILTPTETIRNEIEQTLPGQVTAPIRAFYNGVDTEAFMHLAPGVRTDATLRLLTVGAIEPRKNIATLIEAVALLARQQSVHLTIGGGVRDPLYRADLEQLIGRLGLETQVTFSGFVSEARLLALYQHADLFLAASADEGFNLPPLEAMACGIPVVCSNIAVHQELFKGAALFHDTFSAVDLAACIRTLLGDPDLRESVVAEGHRTVARFSWTRTAQNVAASLALLHPAG